MGRAVASKKALNKIVNARTSEELRSLMERAMGLRGETDTSSYLRSLLAADAKSLGLDIGNLKLPEWAFRWRPPETGKYSTATTDAALQALRIIFENAPSTVVPKVVEYLSERAAQFEKE